jgi:hypothetical protein
MINQLYSSASTSVNSQKLPAIYKKLNWDEIGGFSCVLDYGAGKYTNHIKKFVNERLGAYFPYDPYNISAEENQFALSKNPTIIICSNVLNVITPWEAMCKVHSKIRSYQVPYFISIYEGDRSYISRQTKQGCWQWNMPICEFIYSDEIYYKGIITLSEYKKFIR